jgi:hypothetical protein
MRCLEKTPGRRFADEQATAGNDARASADARPRLVAQTIEVDRGFEQQAGS